MPCSQCGSKDNLLYVYELDPGCANKMIKEECYERMYGHVKKKHNIEKVNDDQSYGLHIITPLFDEMVFVAIFAYLATHVVIEKDYFVGKMYCPATLEVRGWMSVIDLGYVTYYKAGFLKTCGVEDSFIRFYGDAWLRSFVTGNDNMVGIVGGYFPAVAADLALTKIGIPIVARILSAFFSIIWYIERWLPRTGCVPEFLAELSDSLNILDFIDEVPQPTEWRAPRAPTGNFIYDTYDLFNYPYMRILRVPNYYFTRIKKQWKNIVNHSLTFVTFVRVMCVFFGVRGMLAASLVAFPLWLLRQHLRESFKSGKTFKANAKSIIREATGINIAEFGMFNLRRIVVLLIAGSAVTTLLTLRYQEHREMFKNVRPGTEISDEIFWSGVQFVIRLSRSQVEYLLTWFFMAAGVCLGCSSIYMLSQSAPKAKVA